MLFVRIEPDFNERMARTAACAATPADSQKGGGDAKPLTRCAAARDGDCTHSQCPQLRDNEPNATGRHCPLDTHSDED
jgi:hypothetical protein